ncbi:hypothetical protein KCU65_g6581, partial [Aureobasidium melanogenum]
MRFTTVILSCFASQMAVQATSFVTIVKTVEAVSSVDVSTPALNHTSFSELPTISRREEHNLSETTAMTRIHLTSPYTTYVDIPVTPLPTGKSKPDASVYIEPADSTRSTKPTKTTKVKSTKAKSTKVKSTKVKSTDSTASMTRIHLTYPYTTAVDIPLTALPSGYVEPTHKSIKSTNSTESMTRYHFTSPCTTDVDIPMTAVRTEKFTRPVGFATSTTSTTSTTFTSSTSSSTTSTPPSACDIYPYPDGYCDDSSTTTSGATGSATVSSGTTSGATASSSITTRFV